MHPLHTQRLDPCKKKRLYEAPAYDKAEAVAFLKGVPNGVSKDLLGAPDKLKLTSKGAVLADEWETFDCSNKCLREFSAGRAADSQCSIWCSVRRYARGGCQLPCWRCQRLQFS